MESPNKLIVFFLEQKLQDTVDIEVVRVVSLSLVICLILFAHVLVSNLGNKEVLALAESLGYHLSEATMENRVYFSKAESFLYLALVVYQVDFNLIAWNVREFFCTRRPGSHR